MEESIQGEFIDETVHWLNKQIGEWVSERRYTYLSYTAQGNVSIKKIENVSSKVKVEKITESQVYSYRIGWISIVQNEKGFSTGEMEIEYNPSNPNILTRSRGYFTDKPTSSNITLLLPDKAIFTTEYNGSIFYEVIDNVSSDVRTRTTQAFKDGSLRMIGQYVESRQWDL